MINKIRARISSAHLIAGAALFVALGGAAYAVQANSVGTKQLKKNAVATKKIKDAAVTTGKLADNAATGAKVDEASLGKVPLAEKADSATTANTATSAAAAIEAANSAQLAGFGLPQVRSTGEGNGSLGTIDLPLGLATQVLSDTVTIPAGGADVVATASVGITTDAATASTTSCLLQADPGPNMSQNITADFPATDDYSQVITVPGFANHVQSGGGNVEIRVLCGTDVGNTSYSEGSLNIVVIPDD
jgi:hypothetical protein